LRTYDLEIDFWISKISVFYSSVAEDVSLLGRNAVFMGKLLTILHTTVGLQNMANYSHNNSVMLQHMSL